MCQGLCGNTTTYARLFRQSKVCGRPVSKQARVHFLTAYLEYLYDQGSKSEYYYVGDASRYLRFLIQNSRPEDIQAFLSTSSSAAYRRRLAMTLKKFYAFAAERLDVTNDPFMTQPGATPIDNP